MERVTSWYLGNELQLQGGFVQGLLVVPRCSYPIPPRLCHVLTHYGRSDNASGVWVVGLDSRHVICSCPRRSVFNIIVARHMLRSNDNLVARFPREEESRRQSSHSGPIVNKKAGQNISSHHNLPFPYPTTTTFFSVMSKALVLNLLCAGRGPSDVEGIKYCQKGQDSLTSRFGQSDSGGGWYIVLIIPSNSRGLPHGSSQLMSSVCQLSVRMSSSSNMYAAVNLR